MTSKENTECRNSRTTYPIQVTKDLREDLKDLLSKHTITCSVLFDKWNNILLLEVENE